MGVALPPFPPSFCVASRRVGISNSSGVKDKVVNKSHQVMRMGQSNGVNFSGSGVLSSFPLRVEGMPLASGSPTSRSHGSEYG